MTMNAYSKIYLEDSMHNLAIMLDYGCQADGDLKRFFDRFIVSDISKQLERGNPKYLAGYSGIELAQLVLKGTGSDNTAVSYYPSGRSLEYWSGWVLAYIQWYTNMSFERLADRGVDIRTLIRLYPTLHEADITKVTTTLLSILDRNNRDYSPLKRFRKIAGLTQKQLAELAGVKIRMIQAYEQHDQDISKAEVATVLRLSRCLGCSVEDLVCAS